MSSGQRKYDLHIKITEEEKREFTEFCEQNDITLSALVRKATKMWIAAKNRAKAQQKR